MATRISETYKGRKLQVKRHRNVSGYVRTETYVNGEKIGSLLGWSEKQAESEMATLRGYVDDADARPGAYGSYMYEGAADDESS